jgi:hypothetical protein
MVLKLDSLKILFVDSIFFSFRRKLTGSFDSSKLR